MLEFYCFGILYSLNDVQVVIAQIIIIAHNLIALFILHVCWSGDGAIRFEQLNLLIKWINEFQAVTRREDEMVMFDVLCGDFNFDNCSPGTYWQNTLHVLIRSVFMQRCLNGGCGVSVCVQTTGWSKATVCLRSILTPAEPELAERSPGSSVTLSITVHSHSCTVCGKKFLFLFLSWCCVVFDCKMFG